MRAGRAAALQQAFTAAVPKELVRSSRVGYETQDTLVLLATSGAVAARLRHLAPRLLLTIQKQFPEVKAIRTEVQLVRSSTRPVRAISRIGATGLRSLRRLESSLEPGPLRSAVSRLIQHREEHDGRPGPDDAGRDDHPQQQGGGGDPGDRNGET